jgi:uncharacterized protein (DUF2141 family)
LPANPIFDGTGSPANVIVGWKRRKKNATGMKWPTVGILLFLAACLRAEPAWAAPAANLSIKIENVVPGGMVRLGLYDEARYPDDNSVPVASADIAAVPSETTVTLHGLPPGIYAIQTYQDVNADGKMDTSWLGLPLEPFGFSRDAIPFLSKPSFAEVKFTLSAGENAQVIHLQNSVKTSPADKARDAIRARQRQ